MFGRPVWTATSDATGTARPKTSTRAIFGVSDELSEAEVA